MLYFFTSTLALLSRFLFSPPSCPLLIPSIPPSLLCSLPHSLLGSLHLSHRPFSAPLSFPLLSLAPFFQPLLPPPLLPSTSAFKQTGNSNNDLRRQVLLSPFHRWWNSGPERRIKFPKVIQLSKCQTPVSNPGLWLQSPCTCWLHPCILHPPVQNSWMVELSGSSKEWSWNNKKRLTIKRPIDYYIRIMGSRVMVFME